jgi:hypothetical protein
VWSIWKFHLVRETVSVESLVNNVKLWSSAKWHMTKIVCNSYYYEWEIQSILCWKL